MQPSPHPSGFMRFLRRITFVEIIKGLWLTLRHLFSRPVTRQYPAQRREPVAGARGLHALVREPDSGLEKCVGCGLCAAMCPSQCIRIDTRAGDNDEKVVDRYEINTLKCLYCGLCTEACPYGAVVMTGHFAFSGGNREDFIFTKERLLESWDQHLGEQRSGECLVRLWRPRQDDLAGKEQQPDSGEEIDGEDR
jgi:NADH-quinone oxidoreductase subunit I